MNKFGMAEVKGEGEPVFGHDFVPDPNAVETTWIEFSLPVALEDECRAMIDVWLKEKGDKNDR